MGRGPAGSGSSSAPPGAFRARCTVGGLPEPVGDRLAPVAGEGRRWFGGRPPHQGVGRRWCHLPHSGSLLLDISFRLLEEKRRSIKLISLVITRATINSHCVFFRLQTNHQVRPHQNSAASSRPLAWNHPCISRFFMNSSCTNTALANTMPRYTGKNQGSEVNTLPHSFCATTRL